jgi:hypothetical protein
MATELLSKVWTRNDVAWGLASSHPYAIRTLERVTGRRCDPLLIGKYARELIKSSQIPYFQSCAFSISLATDDQKKSIVHSNFFVDHTEVNRILVKEMEGQNEKAWMLGSTLEDGDEFFGFTFSEQPRQ